MKRRIGTTLSSLVICATIISSLIPSAAFAVGPITVSNGEELRTAIGQNIHQPESIDIVLTNDIVLDKYITVPADKIININGSGKTLSSSDGQSIITVSAEAQGATGNALAAGHLTLSNITLTGGKGFSGWSGQNSEAFNPHYGGAIYNAGVLTVNSGTVFSGNSADWGGAIYLSPNAKATINDGLFEGNTADSSGGAIKADYKAGLTIHGGTFKNNSAPAGGVIQITNYDGASEEWMAVGLVDGGTFENNHSNQGGVINNEGQFTIAGGNFTGNDSREAGGVVYNTRKLLISGGSFTNNNSPDGAVVLTMSGADEGATFTGGIFVNNTATYGGVVNQSRGPVSFSGGTFEANTAKTYGGVIYTANNEWADSILTINNGTVFRGNSAAYGGAVFATLDGAEEVGYAGKIQTKIETIINGGEISGNSASYYGGGIFTYSKLTFNDGLLDGNTADYYGGGIATYYSVDKQVGADLTILGGTISNNAAGYYGGGIYNDTNKPMTVGAKLEGNTAQTGGAIITWAPTILTEKAVFSNNTATQSGGAICAQGPNGTLELGGSIIGNSAPDSGGAIAVSSYDLLSLPPGKTVNFDSNLTTDLIKANRAPVELQGQVASISPDFAGEAVGKFETFVFNSYDIFTSSGSFQSYTVSYDANGGDGAVPEAGKFKAGKEITPQYMPTPFRSGYIFMGWASSAAGKHASSFVVDRDLTLYATWGTVAADIARYTPTAPMPTDTAPRDSNLEQIADSTTPLAPGLITTPRIASHWVLFDLLIVVASLLEVLLALFLILNKRKKQIDQSGRIVNKPLNWIAIALTAVTIVIALGSTSFFLLVEDIAGAITVVGQWTPGLFVLLVVQLVLTIISYKRRYEDGDDITDNDGSGSAGATV